MEEFLVISLLILLSILFILLIIKCKDNFRQFWNPLNSQNNLPISGRDFDNSTTNYFNPVTAGLYPQNVFTPKFHSNVRKSFVKNMKSDQELNRPVGDFYYRNFNKLPDSPKYNQNRGNTPLISRYHGLAQYPCQFQCMLQGSCDECVKLLNN